MLLGLANFRCPECGTSFDPDYVTDTSFRLHLLLWERPETGSRVGRVTRTLIHASLRPGRFFASVAQRKERRVRHAAGLIVAYVIAAMCFHTTAFLVCRTAFFVRLWVEHAQPYLALDTALRFIRTTWPEELLGPTLQMLSVLLSILVIAAVVCRLFRGKLGSLRVLDVAAFHSSAVAFGAFIFTLAEIIDAVFFRSAFLILFGTVCAQIVVLLLLLWFICRRVLSLSRWQASGVLIAGGIVQYGCGAAVSWLLFRLPALLSHELL